MTVLPAALSRILPSFPSLTCFPPSLYVTCCPATRPSIPRRRWPRVSRSPLAGMNVYKGGHSLCRGSCNSRISVDVRHARSCRRRISPPPECKCRRSDGYLHKKGENCCRGETPQTNTQIDSLLMFQCVLSAVQFQVITAVLSKCRTYGKTDRVIKQCRTIQAALVIGSN